MTAISTGAKRSGEPAVALHLSTQNNRSQHGRRTRSQIRAKVSRHVRCR